jgi:hypothetical protein
MSEHNIDTEIAYSELRLRSLRKILERYPDAILHRRVDGRDAWMSAAALPDCTEVMIVCSKPFGDEKESRAYVYPYVDVDGSYVFGVDPYNHPLGFSVLRVLKDRSPEAFKAIIEATKLA